MTHRVGILTGGGDAPGLNAVIRAVVKYGVGEKGWHVVGVEDCFNGLVPRKHRVQELTLQNTRGILARGGTILGTTNRGDPFAWVLETGEKVDLSKRVADHVRELGLEGLIVIGGDGTQRIAMRMMTEHGVNVLGVPKTIDNDLGSTDLTFGFQTAVDCVTDALDRLHTTAESHDRVLVLEVMGRDAGFIAVHGGLAGGADVVLVPELPWHPERLCSKIQERAKKGRPFSLIVVSEAAHPIGETVRAGQAGARVVDELRRQIPHTDVRLTVLGHLQRGGSPCAFDRLLATRFGVCAVDLIEAGRWGDMVALRDGSVRGVPLSEAVSHNRTVDPAGELVHTARSVGISFGD